MNLSSITKILVRLSEIKFDCSSLSSTGPISVRLFKFEFDWVRFKFEWVFRVRFRSIEYCEGYIVLLTSILFLLLYV